MSTAHPFRSTFAANVFRQKYAKGAQDTWSCLAHRLVEDVCGKGKGAHPLLSDDDQRDLVHAIEQMQFIPGGRYLYYAGLPASFFNNCFLLRAEQDTREEWSDLTSRSMSCLMSGGGIGVDYSRLRPSGRMLNRTGGVASGPVPLMHVINEVGRNVMQGGSRRSAIYGSLDYCHEDVWDLLKVKTWSEALRKIKEDDFNFPAPLDMTNISINWREGSLKRGELDPRWDSLFEESVRRMMETGEPGHSYNFGKYDAETLRNACTELTSEDDSDCCNLGSINLSRIGSIEELRGLTELAGKFLVCGSLRGELPYKKVYDVREKNRRIGLGIMGIHEWLLSRGAGYEVTPELVEWLEVWKRASEKGANEQSDRFFIARPKGYRAIAPTGTIGILASTTTGIEPVFALAYKRRYLIGGDKWKYEYVVDATAEEMIKRYGLDPSKIETAYGLAADPERRIRFQYEIQKFVDHAISSTINLEKWGSEHNNEGLVGTYAALFKKYMHGLRGITVYPNGARGGQPLTVVDYEDAKSKRGVVYDESEERCAGGVCGV